MKYIECPNTYRGSEKSLFLAGGITGCSDWQLEMKKLLADTDLVIFNPRRKSFDVTKIAMTHEQIKWEFDHLSHSTATSFWFTKETLCPITLYELGRQISMKKPIFVGIDPLYQRKIDVEVQLKLARPEIKIVNSLKDLAKQIKKWV